MTQELTVRPLMVDLGNLLFVSIRRGKEEFGFEYLILKIIKTRCLLFKLLAPELFFFKF